MERCNDAMGSVLRIRGGVNKSSMNEKTRAFKEEKISAKNLLFKDPEICRQPAYYQRYRLPLSAHRTHTDACRVKKTALLEENLRKFRDNQSSHDEPKFSQRTDIASPRTTIN